jgi:hypothetical protein
LPKRRRSAASPSRTPRRTSTKKSGMKKMASSAAVSMPPITDVPIATRLLAPAPVAMASGRTPKMKAKLVIRIGRKRIRAASTAASMTRRPLRSSCSANSIIRIAFFAASPIVVSNPICR